MEIEQNNSFLANLLLFIISYLQLTAQIFILMYVFEGGIKHTATTYFGYSGKLIIAIFLILILNIIVMTFLTRLNLIRLRKK